MTKPVRVRMAPSPTGPFHVGSARTALFNYLFARHHGGVFVLRIEDTDLVRSTEESLQTIFAGMRWLGLEWDEGPDVGGDCGPYLQSQRLYLYAEQTQRLLDSGLAYPCYCTPEELKERRDAMAAAGEDPKYDGRCRDLGDADRDAFEREDRKAAIRFRFPTDGVTSFEDAIRGHIEFENRLLDDFVIRKSDGYPTYNFAAVVDDAQMGMTHVIRGEDGISNTPRQIQVYHALGYELPTFAHLPLLLGKDRSKLSKRHGSTALMEFRDQGILPTAMVNFLALLGWSPAEGDADEIFTMDELVRRFELSQVNKAGAVFDLDKLGWMNGKYLRQMDLDELVPLCARELRRAGLVDDATPSDKLRSVVALNQERIKSVAEIADVSTCFFCDFDAYEEKPARKWFSRDTTPQVFRQLAARLSELEPFSVAGIEAVVRGLSEEMELAASHVIHPTRLAVSGVSTGPGLFEMMNVLGREICVRRIENALAAAEAGCKTE